MYTAEALLDLNQRGHRGFQKLLAHCGELSDEELNREMEGFSYPTVRLQLHHVLTAEEYWIGVLQGKMLADDNPSDYPTLASLETFREQVVSATETYLRAASPEELNTPRTMLTWGNKERVLTPALVVMRPLTHMYQHQGQVAAMCRLMGKPIGGIDFPIT